MRAIWRQRQRSRSGDQGSARTSSGRHPSQPIPARTNRSTGGLPRRGFYCPVSRASLQKTAVYWAQLTIFGSFPRKRSTIVRGFANSQKHAVGRLFRAWTTKILQIECPSREKGDPCVRNGQPLNPGWRRSADRTRLQTNSLLTGNFTGKIAVSGLLSGKKPLCRSAFSHNSLRKLTGKIFRRTVNF